MKLLKRATHFALFCVVFAACNTVAGTKTTVLPTATAIQTASATPASTETAIPTPTFQPERPPWITPSGIENVLPAPLYYVSEKTDEKEQSNCGSHIVKIGRDGLTRTVLTPCYFSGKIKGFSVSPIDKSVVLAARGGLWLINEGDQEPKMLLMGSPNPEYTDSSIFALQNPLWSPDGTIVAYEDDGGIRILKMATKEITDVANHDMCLESASHFGLDPCLYRGKYNLLQWSIDSKALLALKTEEDSHNYVIFTVDANNKFVSRYDIDQQSSFFETIVWGKDGLTFLFDEFEREAPRQNTEGKYALWRISRDGSNKQLVWPYQERQDFISRYNISERQNINSVLETTGGQILFTIGDYLVELNPNADISNMTRIVAKISKLNCWDWQWYKDGKYVVFRRESGRPVDNGNGYSGKEYIGVMEIDTGRIYLLATEDRSSYPSYEEILEVNHLIWGTP